MIVDFRSDVLTKPTTEMKEAMMSASAGDDVFNEEQTTRLLQERVAKLTGKEDAIFLVSGTMANQLAIASLTQPHDEVILDIKSHIFQFEQGAPSVISGVQLRPISFIDSLPDEKMIEDALRFPDIHHPNSRLLCLEATHNYNGGMIPDLENLKKVAGKASGFGLKIHIDGARIWNAVIESGTSITEYTSLCDSMMFCFSKGLGAPIGSILVGSEEVINRARYIRKGLGGGWRKPGMLAAAAIYALDHHIDRLAEDHRRAQRIAETINENPELEIVGRVDTNMVFFRPIRGDLEAYSNKLTEKGILQSWQHFNAIRMVIYLGIDDAMIDYTVEEIQKIPAF